jgi:hypothetical protein
LAQELRERVGAIKVTHPSLLSIIISFSVFILQSIQVEAAEVCAVGLPETWSLPLTRSYRGKDADI